MLSRRALLLAALPAPARDFRLNRGEDSFLEDLSRRSFQFFWEQANSDTGLVRDRALADRAEPDRRTYASSAATGFGLAGICIAAERKWVPKRAARERIVAALRFYAERSYHQRGWFYHFVDSATGDRWRNNEVSSIDTALLVAGMLVARGYFRRDKEIGRLVDSIWQRIDFRWMLDGDPSFFSMGWKPESGFLRSRWHTHNELQILCLLGIASPAMPVAESVWYAWKRPEITYGSYRYISGAPPLFVHQFSHAWIDFRGTRERNPPHLDWFANSAVATRAHRQFCLDLAARFPRCYDENLWGITASDSARGYVAWGGPPATRQIDGTVVPCAAAGSLMLAPDICLPALLSMRERFGGRIWKRYGFVDAFHPVNGWTNPDVIGIDLGITLVSAENLRTGNVWKWFSRNPEVQRAYRRLFA